ncbi:hypothetical protein Goshw_018412 [Gossypium schwendimanii]|uniref:Reverse transcriptase zinc-binding domain-containing protein n=1 Tax=Gossypium schwendimanii TaxID=34291 RepID=A0A7J9KLV9_GOSSC|nr:hypothetical protein [Gossypium schwendimanii]
MSSYKILKEDTWNPRYEKWKSALKNPGPQRVCFFIWTILKQRLLSNVERVKRGLAVVALVLLMDIILKTFCIFLGIIGCYKPLFGEQIIKNWVLINNDGAVQLDSGNAAVRRVVHDENGD